MSKSLRTVPTSSHWGNYRVEVRDGRVTAIHPYAIDANTSPIGQALLDAQDPGCRVPQPMIRRGYLDKGWRSDASERGRQPFVAVDWDTALDIAGNALQRVRSDFGNESIFAGSYGWASAGRFHHAQGQLKRFLNLIGGFTYSKNTYSFAAAEVIVPHVLGMSFGKLIREAPTVEDIASHSDTVICFGGIALKNTQVMQGGLGAHTASDQMRTLANSDTRFFNISPIKDDMADFVDATWWPIRPNTDVAVMLGLAHTIISEDWHDQEFLNRYCCGFERFLAYLMGGADGQPRDADWAAAISRIAADDIRELAKQMARGRTLIGISWSLQRAEHGEQTYWMATLLSAVLGQVGLAGAGVAYGYGSVHNIGFAGRRLPEYRVAAVEQGRNAIDTYIPVARITDMLLHPGEQVDYNGHTLTYPDTKLVYWAGGNPFHHHQDLNRLRQAWARPDTIIVNEPFWTATARHADIVLPSTIPLERNDFSAGPTDCFLTPMRKAIEPYEQSRSDFEIFAELATRFDVLSDFTQDRDEMGWLEQMYATTRKNAAEAGVQIPDFESFWNGEQFSVESQLTDRIFAFEKFREDPDAYPLATPSGKIELYSEQIAGFGYDDCCGHPKWYDKTEWLGCSRAREYPLHLISNQPRTRLHSQYDHAATSRKAKINEREVVRINPQDASARNLVNNDIVRIFNDRGACLAAVILSENIRIGVIELPTGAWYDPDLVSDDRTDDRTLEVHGNPNVLTRDIGTSRLAQGPTAHSCLVEVERFDGELPKITVFSQPRTAPRQG
jgi:biotin/methionine sulfoxide reductase